MAAECELVGNEGLNGALELLTGEVIVRIHVLLLHATLGSPESVGRLLTMWNDLLGQSSSAISVAVGRMMRMMRVEGGGVFLVVLGSGGDYVRLIRLVILMNGRIGMGE